MNPHAVFCPNPDCPARGRCGEGNIWIHARTPPRYRCTVCDKTFGARAGTLFHRRSTDEATIICVLTLLAYGCPPAAIDPAFGVRRQTVRGWQDAAGVQGAAVHRQVFLAEQLCLVSPGRLAYEGDVVSTAQRFPDAAAHERVIIRDDDPNRFHRLPLV